MISGELNGLVIVILPDCKVFLTIAQLLDPTQEEPTARVTEVPTGCLVQVHHAWLRPVFFHKKPIM